MDWADFLKSPIFDFEKCFEEFVQLVLRVSHRKWKELSKKDTLKVKGLCTGGLQPAP